MRDIYTYVVFYFHSPVMKIDLNSVMYLDEALCDKNKKLDLSVHFLFFKNVFLT